MSSTPPGPAEVQWQMPSASEWQYCPRCGGPLTWRDLDGQKRRACLDCGFVFWAYPWPSVVGLVQDPHGRMLVTRRKYPPEPGGYCLPGGHMELGEDPETAVLREVAEETGVQAKHPRLLIVLPTGRRTGFVMFFALAAEDSVPEPGSDAVEAAFWPVADVPALCFETHREVMRQFLTGAFREKFSVMRQPNP